MAIISIQSSLYVLFLQFMYCVYVPAYSCPICPKIIWSCMGQLSILIKIEYNWNTGTFTSLEFSKVIKVFGKVKNFKIIKFPFGFRPMIYGTKGKSLTHCCYVNDLRTNITIIEFSSFYSYIVRIDILPNITVYNYGLYCRWLYRE